MSARYFVDGAGYVWREDAGEGGGISMARVNPDNSSIPEPRTYLLPVSDDEGLLRVMRAVEFTQAGHEQGVADERARCIKVLEDLRGSRLWTSLAHDALNEAIAALKTNASSSSGQG